MKGAFVPLSVSYRDDDRILGVEPMAELLFVRSLAFCKEKGTGGAITRRQLRVLTLGFDAYGRDPDELAAQLEREGLWLAADDGWLVRAWLEWNGTESSEAGRRGNHIRWHVGRGQADEECSFCQQSPPDRPRIAPDIAPESGQASGLSQKRGEERRTSSSENRRDDVDSLCDLLADLIERNGSKRPAVTKAWRDAARLMLDKDGREYDKARRLIEWCQRDEFWRANVLSMPTFRDKYDRLRLKANESVRSSVGASVALGASE